MLAAASRMKADSSAYGAEQDRNGLLDFGPMRRLCPNAFHRTVLGPAVNLVAASCADFHTSKTEMVCPRVYFAFAARADDIARTILRVAKKRAAAVHAFLLSLGSAGSNGESGPCGLIATAPLSARVL